MAEAVIGLPRLALIGLLRLYRLVISPLYGQTCRFYPSCSAYALEAVTQWGAVRGCWLSARRLLRCHPWNPGGVDPVPARGAPSADAGTWHGRHDHSERPDHPVRPAEQTRT